MNDLKRTTLFSGRMIRLHVPPPTSLSRQQIDSLSHSFRVSPVQLIDKGWGRERAWSRIIWPQEAWVSCEGKVDFEVCTSHLKRQCDEIFFLGFFHYSSSPKHLICIVKRHLDLFINKIRAAVCNSRCTIAHPRPLSLFFPQIFHALYWVGLYTNLYIDFLCSVLGEEAIWYCWLWRPPVSVASAANLPPASLTPVANSRRCNLDQCNSRERSDQQFR